MNHYLIHWRIRGNRTTYQDTYYADNAQEAVDECRKDNDDLSDWYIEEVFVERYDGWNIVEWWE